MRILAEAAGSPGGAQGMDPALELLDLLARGRTRPPSSCTQPWRRPPDEYKPADKAVQAEFFLCLASDGEEADVQDCVPVALFRPAGVTEQLPCVIFMHHTGSSIEGVRAEMEDYARRGYIAVGFDCRYHGVRALSGSPEGLPPGSDARDVYQDELLRAFLGEVDDKPFLMDNAWDAMAVVDALLARGDVDPSRVAACGFSLGGMVAWLLAAADARVCAAVALLALQDFGWAVDRGRWQGRVDSIPRFFAAAAEAEGRDRPDAELVRAAWDRLLPGMLQGWDMPDSLPSVAPRPLLCINKERDPRCPVAGLGRALRNLRAAYENAGALDNVHVSVFRGCGHEVVPGMKAMAAAWLGAVVHGEQGPWRTAAGVSPCDPALVEDPEARAVIESNAAICALYDAHHT